MFSYKINPSTELRFLEQRHAEQIYALLIEDLERHPELSKSLSLENVRDKIKYDLDLFVQNKGLGVGIWYEGNLAGAIRYHEIDWSNRSTELGYWLALDFEGKGLVTMACQSLIDYAFSELELNRIVISCSAENQKSCAVPKRLGFTKEGILRQSEWLQDRFVDMVIYSLLFDEWKTI